MRLDLVHYPKYQKKYIFGIKGALNHLFLKICRKCGTLQPMQKLESGGKETAEPAPVGLRLRQF